MEGLGVAITITGVFLPCLAGRYILPRCNISKLLAA
jgi:hypothetical protein